MKERIDELKAVRKDLSDHVYWQRKANIVSSLQALLPGKTDRVKAMRDPETQRICTDPLETCTILTSHWQKVFSAKHTDSNLRRVWLDRLARFRVRLSLDQLCPTLKTYNWCFQRCQTPLLDLMVFRSPYSKSVHQLWHQFVFS